MNPRRRLPNRRFSETFNFECNGLRYAASVSWFSDNELAEIFISNGKAGSQADANARDAAITFSIAVQHGADPETIRKALSRDSQNRASTPLGAALDLLLGGLAR
jgi:hypothetical protein